MVIKKKINSENLNRSDEFPLSTEQVLKEIGKAVNKEKIRRHKAKKQEESEVYKLSKEKLVKSGHLNFQSPMPTDLATLKSLIQTIVRDEIRRNNKD